VHANIQGDAWFPQIDFSEWQQVERIDCDADDKNSFAHSFVILERK